jgi:hypothetical protein
VRRRDDLDGGRLLAYFPVQTITDGASRAGSFGFFDVDDAPPWDTWPVLLPYQPPPWNGREAAPEECLLSWVPAASLRSSRPG